MPLRGHGVPDLFSQRVLGPERSGRPAACDRASGIRAKDASCPSVHASDWAGAAAFIVISVKIPNLNVFGDAVPKPRARPPPAGHRAVVLKSHEFHRVTRVGGCKRAGDAGIRVGGMGDMFCDREVAV